MSKLSSSSETIVERNAGLVNAVAASAGGVKKMAVISGQIEEQMRGVYKRMESA